MDAVEVEEVRNMLDIYSESVPVLKAEQVNTDSKLEGRDFTYSGSICGQAVTAPKLEAVDLIKNLSREGQGESNCICREEELT